MKVQCTHCGKVLSDATVAPSHVMRHEPIRRSGRSTWGPDAYVDGERWSDYASRTDPPIRAQQDAKVGVDSAVSDEDVLDHSLLRNDETACICADHYPVIPAWQMTEKGKDIGPHRHHDVDGRCATCGAER